MLQYESLNGQYSLPYRIESAQKLCGHAIVCFYLIRNPVIDDNYQILVRKDAESIYRDVWLIRIVVGNND